MQTTIQESPTVTFIGQIGFEVRRVLCIVPRRWQARLRSKVGLHKRLKRRIIEIRKS